MHAPIRKLPASALARVARPGALDVRVFGRRSGRRHMRGFFGSPGEFLTMAGTEQAARQRVRAMPRPCRQDGSHDAATRLNAEERSTICHRSEEHTFELQSLMRISYAVFCLK